MALPASLPLLIEPINPKIQPVNHQPNKITFAKIQVYLPNLDEDSIVIRGTISGKQVCRAILSHNSKGTIEPYNRERIAKAPYYLKWVESEVKHQGYGLEMINYLRTLGKPVLFESLPSVVGFYLKAGCYPLSDLELFWAGERMFMVICQEDEYIAIHDSFPYGSDTYNDKLGLTNYVLGKGSLPEHIAELIEDLLETPMGELTRGQILQFLLK